MADDINSSGADAPLETPPDSSPQVEVTPPSGGDQPEKLSLRQELEKQFSEHREPKELRKPEKVEAGGLLGPDGKVRDPKTGQFVPKDPEKSANKAVEASAAPAEKPTQKDVQPVAASTPIGPPPGWSAESKAAFNTLPDHLKNDVLKREREVSDGFKKYSEDARKYSEIEQVLAPRRQVFQQAGVTSDAEAINRLFMWENMIRQNPYQAIPALARQYGIDPASFAQTSGGDQPQPDAAQQLQQYVQSAIQPLQSEFQRLQTDRAVSEISQFSKDKPYFEQVKVRMGQLMAQGAATDLESAYQMAIWATPETRAELIQKETEAKLATSQQAQQEQMQRAQNAKRAAISPSSKAPAAPALNGKDSRSKGVRGSIMQAVEQLREERA